MITVTLFKNGNDVVRVRALGHSYIARHGQDVLCAAVSALVQTAYLAVSDIYGTQPRVCDEKEGRFEFDVPSGADGHDAQVIVRAMRVGLKDLSGGYPQNLKLEEA